jgi:NCS1 family nucleobase:cation symporter-1
VGGAITGIIGIVIMPWKLVSDLGAYIFTWLIGYGAMLGAIAGVMLCDYYLIKKTELDVDELFNPRGKYSFGGSGYNWRALAALAIGILPNVPGFLHAASNGSVQVPGVFTAIYTYAWFVGVFIAGATHYLLTALFPVPQVTREGNVGEYSTVGVE